MEDDELSLLINRFNFRLHNTEKLGWNNVDFLISCKRQKLAKVCTWCDVLGIWQCAKQFLKYH